MGPGNAVTKGRWGRWKRRLVVSVLVVILLTVVADVGLSLYLKGQVVGELHRLKADGKAVSVAEITPPPAPDEQNGGPLYAAAADIAEPPSGSGRKAVSYTTLSWTDPADLAKLSECMEQLQPALNLIRKASQRPDCRFDPWWTSEYALADWSRYRQMRVVARLLAAASVTASYQGDQAEPYQRLRMGFRASQRFGEEPMTLGLLVSIAMDNIMLGAAEHVVGAGPVPEGDARRLAQQLTAIDYRERFVRAASAGRATGLRMFESARKGDLNNVVHVTLDPSDLSYIPPGQKLVWFVYGRLCPAWSYADELAFLSVRAEEEPWTALPTREWGTSSPAGPPLQRPSVPSWARQTRFLWHDIHRTAVKVEVTQTRCGLAATALGLELYAQQRDGYPKRLSGLDAIAWPPSEDVFSGHRFAYRREGDTYVLYSIGPDLADDGGKVPEDLGRLMAGSGMDLVWRRTPSPRPGTS